MGKLFAVSVIGFMDNNLNTEFVLAESWIQALHAFKRHEMTWINATELEDAKGQAFDGDMMFDVAEVPT